MDGDVVQLGRYCRHGNSVAVCPHCQRDAETEALKALRDELLDKNHALNGQVMRMWYVLQEISQDTTIQYSADSMREIAKNCLEELSQGQVFRGKL